MSGAETLYLAKVTIYLVLKLSLPPIIAATSVGLIVALLQTLIQLQEQTLAFAVKLVAVVMVFFVTGPWMSEQLVNFFDQIINMLEEMP